MFLENLIQQIKSGAELSTQEVGQVCVLLVEESVEGSAEFTAKMEFLCTLSQRGETANELGAFVENFLELARKPEWSMEAGSSILQGHKTIDVCGTGGDGLHLYNVSTTAVFVLAACGVKVLKHGNRSITSKSGGADVLSQLGFAAELTEEFWGRCLDEQGWAFILAPQYHPAFKAIMPVRQALAAQGQKTLFNLIGPLLNPARPDYQLLGVSDVSVLPKFGAILQQLGRKNAWVMCGHSETGQPTDEFSNMGDTLYVNLNEGATQVQTITPADWQAWDVPQAELSQVVGGTPEENAQLIEDLLSGKEQGAKRDLLLLNVAAALVACEEVGNLEQGYAKAAQVIDSGAAYQTLKESQQLLS